MDDAPQTRPARVRGLSLLRDQRGTASVEAAVMLPVMAICWAGLMLRYDQIERYLDAASSARRDSWAFSQLGCEDCPPNNDSELKVQVAGDNGGASWMSIIQKIPVVNFFVKTITGYEFTATSRRNYEQPPLFGGGTKSTSYKYYAMCNEKSRDGGDVLAGVLCETIKSLGFGFAVGDCPMAPNTGDSVCSQ